MSLNSLLFGLIFSCQYKVSKLFNIKKLYNMGLTFEAVDENYAKVHHKQIIAFEKYFPFELPVIVCVACVAGA